MRKSIRHVLSSINSVRVNTCTMSAVGDPLVALRGFALQRSSKSFPSMLKKSGLCRYFNTDIGVSPSFSPRRCFYMQYTFTLLTRLRCNLTSNAATTDARREV